MEKDPQEPLMSLHPKSSQEKLLWCRSQNEELIKKLKEANLEIGMLKSEIEEFKHLMKTEEVGALILKNQRHRNLQNDLENKIRDLKRHNAALLQRIINLQIQK